MTTIRVALLAGRRRSWASLLMLSALLRLREVEVAAVVVVSEWSWSRVRDWYLRFGWEALLRGLREWGLGREDRESGILRERLREWGLQERSLGEVCRRVGIPFHRVQDINGSPAVSLLAELRCDYGVYSGAGILRQPLLDCFPRGVVNLHCGGLPEIRGMNGVEWHLFHGWSPEVTLHFIDTGIDTGRIVASRVIDVRPSDDVGSLRGKTIVAGIDLLLETFPRLEGMVCRENPRESGRQYFAMAATLKALLEDRLSRLGRENQETPLLPRAA